MNKLTLEFSRTWAKLSPTKRQRRQHRRRLMAEQLEDRRLLAVDLNALHNSRVPKDVNDDGHISAIDVLGIVNYLNRTDSSSVQTSVLGEGEGGNSHMMPDVTGEGVVSPLDALLVINHIIRAEGEPGNVVTFSHQAADLDGNPITSVSVGQTFVLQILVQDMRQSPQGVFAGYFDLDYDESLVRVNMRESQTIQLSGTPTGGTYRLSFNGQTTAPITYASKHPTLPAPFNTDANIVADFNAGLIQTALLGVSNIDLGDAEVVPFTGGSLNGGVKFNYEVKFGGQYANTDVPKMTAADVQLTGGTSPTVTIFNTSDELLVPTLAVLQVDNPNATAADRANLVARSEQTRSFTFAFPKYSSGQSGLFGVASPGSTNMIIDEIGAFTSNQTPGGGDVEVLVELQITALAGGLATFLGNTSDQAPDHDVLVFALDNAVSIADIGFNSLDITITSEITAAPDSASVNENAGPIFIDVLDNDSITTGTGPTITAPIPTTSANGGTVARVTVSGVNGFNYTPKANFNGPDTFNYTITNGSASASATVTITVNPVDDRPVITGPNSRNTNEDTPFTLSGFTITDPDSNNITVTLSLSPNNGTLSQTTFSGTPASVTTALNNITYTPLLNSNAPVTLTISANDGGLTGTKNVSITINPVNDPPINAINGLGTPPAVSVANTGTHTFPSGTFQVTDADPGNALNVTISVLNGTLASNGNTGTSLSFSGSSPVNIGSLIYDPTDGFVGTDTLTITSSDGTASDTDTVTLTVAPPQFPFAAGDTYTSTEGAGTITLTPSPLNNDLKDVGATLTATPASGSTTQGGSFTINGSTFTYTPPADPDFFGTDTFTYTIEQDAAHTPSSTGDTDSTGIVTIDIQPVNDGPINSVPAGPLSVDEDNTLSFSSPNLISVQDIDAGSDGLTVTLSVSHGTLSQTSISGTVQQVNNSLSSLTYTPTLNYFGPDTLTVTTTDKGLPGTGANVLFDTDTVNITINPINDAPTLVVPGKQSFLTDFDNTFSSTPSPFQISDLDAGSNDVQVDLTISVGTLTISAPGSASVSPITGGIRLTGTVTEINTALNNGVNYRSSTDGNRTLSATVSDLGNSGAGGAMTASKTVDVEVLDFVPVDIIGKVFIDRNGDHQQGSDEPGIEGVSITLTGTDFQGNPVNVPTTTNAHGSYSLLQLRPNAPGQPYTITQQPPAFIQGGSSQASLNLDVRGNVTVESGSIDSGADGFVPEFADVWDVFDSSHVAPQNSGVLVGMDSEGQDWSIFYGGGWDMERYGNARLSLNQAGNAGVLTVFDSQLNADRTADVSVDDGTLTYRGRGADRVYRVIGGSELLGSVAESENEGEGENAASGDATTDIAAYTRAVDSIFG